MKTFLEMDYLLQTFLIYTVGICLVLFPILGFFGLLGLIALGAYQLLSGFITAIFFSKLHRNLYLLKALAYLAILSSITSFDLLPAFLEDIDGVLVLLFWFIIPYGIGVWYYRMVKKDYSYYFKIAQEKMTLTGFEINCPFEEKEAVDTRTFLKNQLF